MVRLFFALWPDDLVRKQISLLQAQSGGVGFTTPIENLHATLAFLGEVDRAKIPVFLDAAAKIHCAPFTLELDTREWLKQSQICWLGASKVPERLQTLVSDLQQTLKPTGYQPEQQAFRLHVTLKRRVTRAMRPINFKPIRWRVSRFVLVESVRKSSGAEYRVIHSWDFMG